MILAMDSSGSMLATDVAPDRMTAAREAASSFVENLPDGFRVGVVSFSDQADIVVPPTDDRDRGAGRAELAPGRQRHRARRRDRPVGRPRRHRSRHGARRARRRARRPSSSCSSPTGRTRPATSSRSRRRRRRRTRACPSTRSRSAPTTGRSTSRTLTAASQTIRVPPDPTTLAQVAEQTGGTFFEAADGDALQGVYDETRLTGRGRDGAAGAHGRLHRRRGFPAAARRGALDALVRATPVTRQALSHERHERR